MSGLFGSKTVHNKATQIGTFQINSATYGVPVPFVFGTTRISGNIIDWYDFKAIAHTTTQRTGKGGGSKVKNTTYTYTVACLIGLCEGPIVKIGRVWKGDQVLDAPAAMSLNVFTGQYGQQPWSYTQSKQPAKALPYSGLAYLAGVVDLGDSGSLPNLNFEVFGQLIAGNSGYDANPADVIRHIITDANTGVGIAQGGIDAACLEQFRQFCQAADLLVSSPPGMDTKKAYEIVNELCDATSTICFWSQNKLKLVPMCDERIMANGIDFIPNTTPEYELTADDFLEDDEGRLIVFERGNTAEAFNQASIEFINRANGYEVETVEFQVLPDVHKHGLRPADTKSIHYLHNKERAQYVAAQQAMKSLYRRNRYRFRLDWSFCRLEPGDLVTITLPELGLDKAPVTIEEIEEAEDGELEIVAIPKPPGVYSPARYNVHQAERPTIDYRVSPGHTSAVVFTPPSELTSSGLEFWIAASGGEYWGGCNVWISDNGSTYERIGAISAPSRHGTLTAALPSGQAIDKTNALQVELAGTGGQLLGGSEEDAQNHNTLCWVDGELLAYAGAAMTAARRYQLSYLVRGIYNTPIGSHTTGSKFVRLDKELFKYPFLQDQIGRKVYFKFTSHNIYNTTEQNLEDVAPYEYTLSNVYIPHVQDLALVQHLREVRDGTNLYELEATWRPPATPAYSHADVYIKTSQPNWSEIGQSFDNFSKLDNATLEDMSNADIWKYIGKAHDAIVIPGCATEQTFTVRVAAALEGGFKADFNTAPTAKHLVEIKSYIPQMPQNLSVVFTDVCTWSWDTRSNTDNDYYELRLDTNYGSDHNLLARTNSNKVIAQPPKRSGNVYLYAHNRSGQYSAGAHLEYNKPAPAAPQDVTIVEIFQGMVIAVSAPPPYCTGINVHINDGKGDKVYFSPNNSYTFKAESGIFDVRVAYVDLFGEGKLSQVMTQVIEPWIDPELLKAESLSLEKMDGVIKDAVSKAQNAVSGTVFNEKVNQLTQADKDNIAQITQTKNELTSIVTNKVDGAYTAIAQTNNEVQLRAKSANLISLINVCPEAITLASKLIHITNDVLIDNNVIARGMIQAGAITADKMATNSITIGKMDTATQNTINTAGTNASTALNNAANAQNAANTANNSINSWKYPNSTYIDGGKIHTNTITANQINVSSLSAISATIGSFKTAATGERTEIDDNGMRVYDGNRLRVRLGRW